MSNRHDGLNGQAREYDSLFCIDVDFKADKCLNGNPASSGPLSVGWHLVYCLHFLSACFTRIHRDREEGYLKTQGDEIVGHFKARIVSMRKHQSIITNGMIEYNKAKQ